MGVHGFNDFIKKMAPHVFEAVNIKKYRYRKIAVDIATYLFKFKHNQPDNWLKSIANFCKCLRKRHVHPIIIFDGKSPPEKYQEQQKRKASRDQQQARAITLRQELVLYEEKKVASQILLELYQKLKRKTKKNKLMLCDLEFDGVLVTNYINGLQDPIKITPDDIKHVQQILDALKIPWIVSPTEADTLCSKLYLNNAVDAVLSNDSDLLTYSVNTVLSDLNMYNGSITRKKHENVLSQLGLTESEFLDFCIMCGVDYNKNVKGIGPMGAYKLVKKYSSIENIIKHLDDVTVTIKKDGVKVDVPKYDTSVLKYESTRAMFTAYNYCPGYDDYVVPYCLTPDFDALGKFMRSQEIEMDVRGFRVDYQKKIV